MAKSFELLVRVNSANLTTVIDVLKNAAEIISLKQVDVETTPEAPKRIMRPRDGVTAEVALLEAMKPGVTYSVSALGEAIARRGFSPNSAHPALSPMVKSGKVVRVGQSLVKLA